MDDLRSDEGANRKNTQNRRPNITQKDIAFQAELSEDELPVPQRNRTDSISADTPTQRRKKIRRNRAPPSNFIIQADLSNDAVDTAPIERAPIDEIRSTPTPAQVPATGRANEPATQSPVPIKPINTPKLPPDTPSASQRTNPKYDANAVNNSLDDNDPTVLPKQFRNADIPRSRKKRKWPNTDKGEQQVNASSPQLENKPNVDQNETLPLSKSKEVVFANDIPHVPSDDTIHSNEELLGIETIPPFKHVSSLVKLKTLASRFTGKDKHEPSSDSDTNKSGRVHFLKDATYIETSSYDSLEPPTTDNLQEQILIPKYNPFANYNDSVDNTSSDDNAERKPRDSGRKSRRSSRLRGVGSFFHTNLNAATVFVYMIIPPDGGYGWFIVFTSFLCQVIVDGIIFSIGVLLPKISEEFDIRMGYIVVIAAVQIGCYFLSGTLASALVNAYGFRPVAIAGCTLAIFAEALASFSNGLVMMLAFYSIMSAPGLSMIWVSSQLIIGYYFERLRPIANGLSVSGAGMGMFVFCFLSALLLPLIGWRNVMRVHCAFLIVAMLLSLSFLPVKPKRVGKIIVDEIESDSSFERASLHLETYRYSKGASIDIEIPAGGNIAVYEEKPPKRNVCCSCCRKKKKEQQATYLGPHEENVVIKVDPIERTDLFFTGAPDYAGQSRRSTTSAENVQGTDMTRAQSVGYNLGVINNRKEDSIRDEKVVTPSVKKENKRKKYSPINWIPSKVRRAFKLLFDFKLLKVFEFKILLLSAFLFPMGLNIPFVYSKLRTEIDATSAALITPTIGLSNLIFRIISGFIAFKYKFLTTFLCGFGIWFGGLFVFISAFYGANVVWFQFLYAFCYGVAPAFYSTLRAIIYVNSLGLDKLTTCFGLTALAMGLGAFIGTTTGGILTELTGIYSPAFCFAGLCVMTSGLLKILLPFLIKRRRKAAASNPV